MSNRVIYVIYIVFIMLYSCGSEIYVIKPVKGEIRIKDKALETLYIFYLGDCDTMLMLFSRNQKMCEQNVIFLNKLESSCYRCKVYLWKYNRWDSCDSCKCHLQIGKSYIVVNKPYIGQNGLVFFLGEGFKMKTTSISMLYDSAIIVRKEISSSVLIRLTQMIEKLQHESSN